MKKTANSTLIILVGIFFIVVISLIFGYYALTTESPLDQSDNSLEDITGNIIDDSYRHNVIDKVNTTQDETT